MNKTTKIAMQIFADYTRHYNYDRKLRESFIQNVIGGYGREIYLGFTHNKQNSYLAEVHKVYDNGIIVVVNPYRGMDKIVTTKIARPGQLKAVYELPYYLGIDKRTKQVITKEIHKSIPSDVMKKAIFYSKQGWNNDDELPPIDEWSNWRQKVSKL